MIYETMRVPAKPRGGALPTYQRQGEIHAPGAGVNVRMDDSAARIAGTGADAEARALAGLGKAIQGAADVGLKAYDDYQTVKATEGYNAFQQAMNDKLYGENGIFTRQGEAAFGSAEDMERAISETREDVARQLGLSDVARQKLGKQVFAYGLQFVPKAQKHAADERKKWADGQDQASLELNLEGFLNNPNDTQARLMYLSTMQQSYHQYADRNGLGAEQRELGWKKILSAAYSQLADKYITAGDLNAARKLVADEPLWMEGDQDKIRAKIKKEAERQEREAKLRQIELRVGLAGRIEDAEAAWKDGLDVENAPTHEEVAAAYGKDAPKIWEQIERLRSLSVDVRSLRAMSPEEQDVLLMERKPEAGEGYADKRKVFVALTKAVEEDRKARADDPAAYLVSVEPEVKAARQTMLQDMTPDSVTAYAVALKAAREARGMAESKAAFLPEADAKQIAVRLENSPQPVEAIQQLASFAGKYWPDMLKQLSESERLSSSMRLVASGMDPDAGKKLLESARDKDFVTKAEDVLGISGTTKTEFQDHVRERMADFNRTLMAGGERDLPATLNRNVERLALCYMMDGYDADEAVEKAADKVVLERYSLTGHAEKPFRVPATFDANNIEDGAEEILQSMTTPGKLEIPNLPALDGTFTETSYSNWVRREGYWVTNGDESGVVLFVGGRAVRDRDGNIIEKTWDELDTRGRIYDALH